MTLCLLRITKLLSSIDFVCQQQRRTRHLDIDRFAYPHALIAAYLSSSSSIAFRAFCKIWLGGLTGTLFTNPYSATAPAGTATAHKLRKREARGKENSR